MELSSSAVASRISGCFSALMKAAGGGDGQGKEAFHVGAAQAVQSLVALGQAQRIALPAALIEGHGVGVPGQHQAPGTTAQRGDQVGLVTVCVDCLDFGAEAHVVQPAGQQVDDTRGCPGPSSDQ